MAKHTMRRITASTFLLLLWVLATGPLAASELVLGPVYLEGFPEIETVLGLSEDAGGLMPRPAATDLTLVEDGNLTGHARSVRTFRQTGRGFAIVVAIDVSGTMRGEPLAQMRRALLSLLRDLRPQDRIALVSFADDVRIEAPFGASASVLQERVRKLAPRGRITELYRALFKSASLFTPDLPARRRILVISDGKDEGKAYQLEDVIRLAQQKQLPFDAIGLTRIGPEYLSTLERLADLSGGFYAPAGNVEELVRKGMERVQVTPVATFAIQDLKLDDQPHRLGVHWRRGDRLLAAETPVTLIKSREGASGHPGAPGGGESRYGLLWLTLGGLAILAAGIVFWRVLASQRRPVVVPPQLLASVSAPGSLGIALAELARATPTPDMGRKAQPLQVSGPISAAAIGPPTRRKTQVRHEFSTPAAGRPAAVLRGEEGPFSGESFAIEQDPFWIGAADDNQLALQNDDFLSSYHACVRFQEGSMFLYDNRSTNGTFVNGERLAELPRPLGVGDRISVGHSTFAVQVP